ncbi:hypothetical protein [Wolbachia endosymbiont (group A) of Anomoia purmunda]|nr:hypothetical protein [Wolbachia endosymbiont (group A) of Anomoia purmunda]
MSGSQDIEELKRLFKSDPIGTIAIAGIICGIAGGGNSRLRSY